MLGFGKSQATVDAVERKPKRSWSLRRKLLVAVIAIVFVIALAVGLGVGLTRGRGDGDDDGGDGDDGSGDLPESGPDRESAWQPGAGVSWQIVLLQPIKVESNVDDLKPDVEVYDLDLFDNDIETFKTLQDGGKKVICYFSAGSWENFREDKDEFDEDDLGKELDGWPGERWLNLSSSSVRDIMKKRIKIAWQKGCDAIDPDNVDGYQNDNGLGLTADDSIDFMRFLSEEAKSYKMAIGLKNAGDIIPDVIDFVDFSVNEQCIEYSECETFAAFIEADKPVFNIEYPEGAPRDISTKVKDEICSQRGKARGTEDFSIVIKKMDLDGWVEYCDGDTFSTALQD